MWEKSVFNVAAFKLYRKCYWYSFSKSSLMLGWLFKYCRPPIVHLWSCQQSEESSWLRNLELDDIIPLVRIWCPICYWQLLTSPWKRLCNNNAIWWRTLWSIITSCRSELEFRISYSKPTIAMYNHLTASKQRRVNRHNANLLWGTSS